MASATARESRKEFYDINNEDYLELWRWAKRIRNLINSEINSDINASNRNDINYEDVIRAMRRASGAICL